VKTREFKTPFAMLHVYKNGEAIEFEIVPVYYGMYLNDNSYKKPEGLYKVTIDMDMLLPGDILVCEFDKGNLQYDSGDAYVVNIVGTIGNYTVGMGTYDTQDINECYKDNGSWVPYEVWGSTNCGFEVHIIDNPKDYKDRKYFQQLYFDIAWEPGISDEAWDLVSFVTSSDI
jgi:hypothetical protein